MANQHYATALSMWDGVGLADEAKRHQDLYATYKLALAWIASDRLRAELPMRAAMLQRLFAQQTSSGGWITDYRPDGSHHGLANVETSCLAVLALRIAARAD